MTMATVARQAAAWAGPWAHATLLAGQATINAGSAGTTYAIPVGSTSGWTLYPKAGDTIVGLGAATVLDAGAKRVQDLSITNGSAVVTSATAAFVSGDVGKWFVDTTGAFFYNATIASYQSATQVTASNTTTAGTSTGQGLSWGSTKQAVSDNNVSTTGVTVRNVVIKGYTAHYSQSVVFPVNAGSTGWRVINCDISGSGGSGVGGANVAGNISCYGGRLHHHNMIGLQNTKTAVGVELDHNGTTVQESNEAGGAKWTVSNVSYTYCHAHDNVGPGLWSDIDSANITVDHNWCIDNTYSGVFIEISKGPITVTNNTCTRCGVGGTVPGWLWGGGITLAASGGVSSGARADIGNNTIKDCYNGITGTMQTRNDGTPPHVLTHINYHDNTISGATGQVGVVSDIASAVVAAPAPTATTFSVTAGQGTKFHVGMWVNVHSQNVQISAIATDLITVGTMSPVAVNGDAVACSAALPAADILWTSNTLSGGVAYCSTNGTGFC